MCGSGWSAVVSNYLVSPGFRTLCSTLMLPVSRKLMYWNTPSHPSPP